MVTKKKPVSKAKTSSAKIIKKSAPAKKVTTKISAVKTVKTTKLVAKVDKVASKTVAKKAVVKKLSPKVAPKSPAKVATKPVSPVKKVAVTKAPAKTVEKPMAKVAPKTVVKPVKVSVKTAPAVAKVENNVNAAEKAVKATPVKKKSTETAIEVTPYTLQATEDYMNDAQCEHFKEILHTWRAVLLSKLDTAVSHLKDEPKHFADLNDRATQEEEFNLELRARDRDVDLVSDIDEALKRVHDGEYGYCEECGVEIGLRRLEARPTATLCIDCKTLAEMREKQSGGVLPL